MSSWRTTVIGLAGALAAAWAPLNTSPIEWDRIAFAGAIALLGYLAQDQHK